MRLGFLRGGNFYEWDINNEDFTHRCRKINCLHNAARLTNHARNSTCLWETIFIAEHGFDNAGEVIAKKAGSMSQEHAFERFKLATLLPYLEKNLQVIQLSLDQQI